MQSANLISVIIPTYIRAHLISETLDSIQEQTYTNWECLVVDDGSTDGSEKLLLDYIAKDGRFQYCKRSDAHLLGGSDARNYGFVLGNDDYIQWFDSDDLMVADKLAIKIKTILEHNVDFVIMQTQYFNRDNSESC